MNIVSCIQCTSKDKNIYNNDKCNKYISGYILVKSILGLILNGFNNKRGFSIC